MAPRHFILLALAVGGCTGEGAGNVAYVPISVAGVSYQWPFDDTGEEGDPATWKDHAWLSSRLWNEAIGTVPSQKRSRGADGVLVYLKPANAAAWRINGDGSGLPLAGEERFVVLERHRDYVLGEIRGPGIVDPSVTVVFPEEGSAFLTCRRPSPILRHGTCRLAINDRGVEHSFSVRWGHFGDIPEAIGLYRKLVGIPDPARTSATVRS
jgi:hypothetical protein